MGASIGSGSSSTSGYSVTAPPKYISNAYKGIISQAQNTAATPYTAYTGDLTAGLTGTQNQAISNLSSAQDAYQPYYDQAATYGQQATTAVTPMQFNAETLAQYQNPYTNDVVNATLGDLAKLFGTQQTQVTGNAISAGAWGGDRAGIVKSNLANNQSQTAASTLANLRQSAYNNAVSQFNTANNAQMSAQQQNNANALSAAQLYQGLGTGASTNAINLSNALMSAGTQEQSTNQAALDAQYQQFLNQQQYPFQTLSWLTGIATGVGSNAGGTTVGNSTTNTSGWNVGANITSDERAKDDIEPVGELYDGQPIYRYHYKGDDTPRIGLLAQDVEQSHPEAVNYEGGLGSVHYGRATEEAAGLGQLMGYASGGDVMPYGAAKSRQTGLNLPIQQAAQGSGPPRASIPQSEARIPSVPAGQGQQQGTPGDQLQSGLTAIKDKLAPISNATMPGTPPTVSGGVSGGPVPGVGGVVTIPNTVIGGLGGLSFANGGAVETDDEGVPLVFGPDPLPERPNFDQSQTLPPMVGEIVHSPMAGLGQGTPAPQGGLGAIPGGQRVTTYSPRRGGDQMEGGYESSRPGPDGQAMVRTLEDFRTGASPYVTIAGNPSLYGRQYTVPEVSYSVGGQRYTLNNVPTVVHDTGGAFRNAPEGRFDVPVGRDLSNADTNQGLAGLQFIPQGGANPLAVADASGRIRPGSPSPHAGLGYTEDESSLPPNAEATGSRQPPPGIPVPGLQSLANTGPVDEGKAFSAAMQAGLYGLLTTGNIGQAIAAGSQTYNDMQYRLRGQLSPNEKMQLLNQQMYQSQADKLQADVEKARAERTQVVTNPNTGRSYLVDRVTGNKQLLDEGQTADLEVIKDVAGNPVGSFNKRTGVMTPFQAGAIPQAPGLPPGVKPTPDYDNWQIAKANGDQRDFATYQADLKKQGAQSVTIAGESAESKALGEARGKAASEVEAGARNATENMSKLNLLNTLLQRAKTGALAPTESTVVGWTQALGLDPAKLGLNPNQAISDQAISKITNELTVGMIGPGGFPANNFSDADRKFISDIFPKISNRPEANAINLEVLKRIQQRKMEVADAWGNYQDEARGQGKTPSFGEFERQFRKDRKGEDLFGDVRAMVDSLPPQKGASPSSAPAAPPPAPNARQAPDGNWYVPNPNKSGSWMRVVQ